MSLPRQKMEFFADDWTPLAAGSSAVLSLKPVEHGFATQHIAAHFESQTRH
ncbi:MAG: hypothetical protein JSR58_06120, partial [Verrucomicrobia bacterium]|nr:hypothetical protein [Verrucomicrobiota bacterium]